MAASTRGRRGFGALRRLPSKRYQASYVGPDTVRYVGPVTFDTVMDAEAWLTDERRLISAGTWSSPTIRARLAEHGAPALFGDYSVGWLERRELKPRTRELYAGLLRDFLTPAFGSVPLVAITPASVAVWHHDLGKRTGPTRRAHAYGLLRTILRTAVDEDEIAANPCRVRGASSTPRVRNIEPASLEQLTALVAAMPVRFRPMVLLSSWCGLRFGEVTELRRKDVDLGAGTLRIRRAVSWVAGKPIVGTPKSAAGVRDVAIPPHLLPAIRKHLARTLDPGRRAALPTRSGRPGRTDRGEIVRPRGRGPMTRRVQVTVMCSKQHPPTQVERFYWQDDTETWVYDNEAIISREDARDPHTGLRARMSTIRDSPLEKRPDGTFRLRLRCRRCNQDLPVDWSSWRAGLTELRRAGRDQVDLSKLVRTLTR